MNPAGVSADAAPRRRAAWARVLPWLAVAVAASSIRLYRLGHFSYWLDEVLDTYLVRSSWDELWRSLRWQALQAPLDYVLRKLVEVTGPGEAVRRLPGVAWGVACVAAFGILLARRGGRAVGLAGAAARALAPDHVRYSQEVRPYSLGLFLLCASLLALDRYLERPTAGRLAVLYLACLATIYSLYLAALVLLAAAASLVVADAFDPDRARRASARHFLRWSPAFLGALAVGLVPWWPVLIRAIHLPPDSAAPAAFGPSRVVRWLAYFGFRGQDAVRPGVAEILFALLALGGAVAAWRRPRLRFVLVWTAGGLAAIEWLERRHSEFDSIFHWLPAGLGLTALAGAGAAALLRSRVPRPLGVAALAAVLATDARGLREYFRAGRPDWRPVARFLAARPADERIFTENPYTLYCVGFYLCGPDWPPCKGPGRRTVLDVHGDPPTLEQARARDRDAWLLLAGGPRSEALRLWSRDLPSMSFPSAEGDAILRRLPAGGGTR
jgi:hypothetical protein